MHWSRYLNNVARNSLAARSERKRGLRSQVTDVTKNVRSEKLSIAQRLKPLYCRAYLARLKAVRFHGASKFHCCHCLSDVM